MYETLRQRLHRNFRARQIGRLRVTFPIGRLRVNYRFFNLVRVGMMFNGMRCIDIDECDLGLHKCQGMRENTLSF